MSAEHVIVVQAEPAENCDSVLSGAERARQAEVHRWSPTSGPGPKMLCESARLVDVIPGGYRNETNLVQMFRE